MQFQDLSRGGLRRLLKFSLLQHHSRRLKQTSFPPVAIKL